jgi:hypothetical protein
MELWLILHFAVDPVVSMLHDDKASLMDRSDTFHQLHSNNTYEMHAPCGAHAKRLFYESTHGRQAEPYLLVPLADIKFLSWTDCHQ